MYRIYLATEYNTEQMFKKGDNKAVYDQDNI